MKGISITILICLMVFSMIIPAYSNSKGKDDFLIVSGKAINIRGKVINNYTIRIYEGNLLIQSVEYTSSFRFVLKENSEYTIEIDKKGHYPKRVYIDTRIQREKEPREKYVLQIEATVYPKKKGSSDYYYDFPAATIRYSTVKNIFIINEKYINHIRQHILNDQYQLSSAITNKE